MARKLPPVYPNLAAEMTRDNVRVRRRVDHRQVRRVPHLRRDRRAGDVLADHPHVRAVQARGTRGGRGGGMTIETIGMCALAAIVGAVVLAVCIVIVGIAATIAARLYREAGKGAGNGRRDTHDRRSR